MTFALRQALEILQMPQQELAQWLIAEIERNPLLEIDERASPKANTALSEVPSLPSLHDHLLAQIRESFSSGDDLRCASLIFEHLDEKGFVSAPLEEIAKKSRTDLNHVESILVKLQTFDPPGIFARNIQETFLLQLRAQGKTDTTAYRLIRDCFDDLLHKRYTLIKKKLGVDDFSFFSTLTHLRFRPAELYKQETASLAIPDIHIVKIEGGWTIAVDEEELPKFHLQSDYLLLTPKTAEEKESLRTFKSSAKWLLRCLSRRRKLLSQIGMMIVKKQSQFLDQKAPLAPMTLKDLSEKLGVHESTLSRGLSGKFAATPRGLIPLKSLITSSPEMQTAKDLLDKLIQAEDKKSPLTDEQLSLKLQSKGFQAARRTVAKYRTELKIGPATQRKNLSQSKDFF